MGDHHQQADELGPGVRETVVRNRSTVYILGLIEIFCGVGICVVEATTLIMFYNSGAPGYPIEFAGLWTGIFAIITGIIQVMAGKKTISPKTRRWLFSAGVGTTVVCIIQAVVMFALSVLNIYLVRTEIRRRETDMNVITGATEVTHLTVDQLKDLAMLKSVVALVYFSLVIFAIISSVLNCCNACGKAGSAELSPDQVVYTSVDGNQVKQIKIYKKAHHIKS